MHMPMQGMSYGASSLTQSQLTIFVRLLLLLVDTSSVHLLLYVQDMFTCMTKHDVPGGILLASGHQQNSVSAHRKQKKSSAA